MNSGNPFGGLFSSATSTIITLAGMLLAAIFLFDLSMHPQAFTSLLSTGGNFVTTETSTLLAR